MRPLLRSVSFFGLVVGLVVSGTVAGAAQPTLTALPPGGTFIDDDGHRAEGQIEAVLEAGLLGGCGHDEFCPDQRATLSDVEDALSAIAGTTVAVACGGQPCSEVAVPATSLSGRIPGSPSNGAEILDRGTLAMVLADAASLTIRDVPERRTFTIAATGDILPHSPVMNAAAAYAGGSGFDFSPMFADVEPIIAGADLGLCHLETALSPDNTGLSSYPVFLSPREVADAVVETGYEGCSTASNHSYDKRTPGVVGTIEVVEAAGLGHAGTADSADDSSWWFYETNGVSVGHLSYSYGLNGFVLPQGEPWLVNLIDADQIIEDADTVRSLGADFVIVSLHWGAEYRTLPTPEQRDIATELLAADAVDLIIGHHAHVVQPVEQINGKYVLYGLGNLLSNQFFSPETQDGVVAVLEIAEGTDGFFVRDLSFVPTQVERGTYRIVDIPTDLAAVDPSSAAYSTLLASWERTAAALAALDASISESVVPTSAP